MPEPPFDPQPAHRWFATELNNPSWTLLEAGPDTEAGPAALLPGAHASADHWYQTDTASKPARAECLAANAHAAIDASPEA